MWGRNSPDNQKTPHTCKLGRKVLFSDNEGCTIISINGRERRRAEERLRACGALSHDEEIGEAVEAVSFNDTLGEIGKVVEGGLSEDRVIPVSGYFPRMRRSRAGPRGSRTKETEERGGKNPSG